jgi:hypothetical protein
VEGSFNAVDNKKSVLKVILIFEVIAGRAVGCSGDG